MTTNANTPDSSAEPRWRTAAQFLALSVVYFAAAKIGLTLAFLHPSASAVWPPTGIALASFLLLGYRVWPAIALGAFVANATTAGSIATSLGIATGNTLEGLLGAWLVNRFANGRDAFQRPRDIYKFAGLAAGVSTLVSSTVGVASLCLGGVAAWSNAGPIWVTWWLGDAVGALVAAPPILLWTSEGPRRPSRPLEVIGLGILLFASGAALMGWLGMNRPPILWIWIPSVVWVAYRFGARAVATTILAIACVNIWGFEVAFRASLIASPNAALLVLQAFLGVMSLMGMTLAAVATTRDRLMEDLIRARDDLEARVAGRTAALSNANESLRLEMTERARLEREVHDAGERERVRLGRDLHDDLGQILTGIGFLSSVVEKRVAAGLLPDKTTTTEIRSLVKDALTKTHHLARGLTPVAVGTGGLLGALEELAGMIERVYAVTCTLDYDREFALDRPLASTNLYRITQEAINNAVRHGRAGRVEISLEFQDDQLTLTVQDDGVGFGSRDDGRSGLGLSIMKQRAEQLGGTLEVLRNRKGVAVICVVPGIARPIPGQNPADL